MILEKLMTSVKNNPFDRAIILLILLIPNCLISLLFYGLFYNLNNLQSDELIPVIIQYFWPPALVFLIIYTEINFMLLFKRKIQKNTSLFNILGLKLYSFLEPLHIIIILFSVTCVAKRIINNWPDFLHVLDILFSCTIILFIFIAIITFWLKLNKWMVTRK